MNKKEALKFVKSQNKRGSARFKPTINEDCGHRKLKCVHIVHSTSKFAMGNPLNYYCEVWRCLDCKELFVKKVKL